MLLLTMLTCARFVKEYTFWFLIKLHLFFTDFALKLQAYQTFYVLAEVDIVQTRIHVHH